ncbi:MAG: hypothetical protein Q8936_25235, partial [Bacillota bacterium]|nr:hypothetical protein [Bacillota bacterium]
YKAREEALIEKMSLINEAEERGERNKAIKMAKEMLVDGEDIMKVKKYTGLTDEEINSIKNDLH